MMGYLGTTIGYIGHIGNERLDLEVTLTWIIGEVLNSN